MELDLVVGGAQRASWFRDMVADERAFRTWYDAALPRVYGYLLSRSGGVRALAEELTQETFVELVRNRNRFEGGADPMTWVIAIARHRLADHFRRLAREERRHFTLVRDAALEERVDALSASEQRQDITRAMRSLPALQRAALTLHYMDDLAVAEVANLLHRSESAVESLLARGRSALRISLSTPGDEVNDD